MGNTNINFDSVLVPMEVWYGKIQGNLFNLDQKITEESNDISVMFSNGLGELEHKTNILEDKLDLVLGMLAVLTPGGPVDSVVVPPVDSVSPPIDSVIVNPPTDSVPVDSVVVPPVGSVKRYKVGWNLADVNYYSTNVVHNNLLRQAKYRDDFTIDGKNPSLLFWETASKGGKYPTIFETVGNVTWRDTGNGIAVFTAENAVDLGYELRAPGADDGFFHPDYVKTLENAEFIRFMDWCRTNHSSAVTYSDFRDRCIVPFRQQVLLANQVNTIPWFCVPHQASDECITTMAEVVRDNISNHIPEIYVEYSNEIWNPDFEQYTWMTNVPGKSYHEAWADGIKRVSRIWKSVIGNRVKVVLAGQTENIWHTRDKVSQLLTNGEYDIVSCAGYFCGRKTKWQGSVSDTLTEMNLQVDREELYWQAYRNFADSKNMKLIAYEGGFHTTRSASGFPNSTVFRETHRDPKIYDITTKAMNLADKYFDGFGWFNDIYVASNEFAWGSMEYSNQPMTEAHKHRALLDFINRNT